ncbi:hypothetical protein LCGC14_2826070, partial [marine sediment metagenome]
SLDRIRQEGVGKWQTGGPKQSSEDYPHKETGGNENRQWKISAGLAEKDKAGTLSGRTPRSVLDVPTKSYSGAHYATFPPNLIAPLIRATCPRWACPVCGQGWSPVVEKEYWKPRGNSIIGGSKGMDESNSWTGWPVLNTNTSIKGYRPTCEHPHTIEEAVPGNVLDPFFGSGTVGEVCNELQRSWVGLDISMEYLTKQARYRTKYGDQITKIDDLPMFKNLEE